MINTSVPLPAINSKSKNTMLDVLGIEITSVTKDSIEGTMPVDSRTHQPAGLLHGGASAALIESLGSIGSSLIVDLTKFSVVGVEINANHIRGLKEGRVTGNARIIHAGKKTHVWQVDIADEKGKLVCTGRLTVLIVPLSE